MRIIRHLTSAALAAAALAPVAAHAQATELEDLVGARAGQAENAVRMRGYDVVRTETGDDRKYAYWWHEGRRQCVTIATMDGRYNSITATPAPDCRRGPEAQRPDYGYPPGRPERPVALPGPVGPPTGGPVVGGRPVSLGLVCFGDGQKPVIANSPGWTWNPDRDRYDYGNRVTLKSQQFDAQLIIQLWDGGGRIRLPRSLIPPINSRGDNGWWDLSDVVVGRDRINARYRLNGLNKPTIAIDRRSGRISVQGTSSYGFRGQCDTMDHGDRLRF